MLQINDLTYDAWGRRFFDEASVTIPAGGKVGVVGRNGVGKTTLFGLIKDQLGSSFLFWVVEGVIRLWITPRR